MPISVPIHPSLLKMARVILEEAIPPADGTAWILFATTFKLPTLKEVHVCYDPHFEELRGRGDPLANAKEASFYRAIQHDLAEIGPGRILVMRGPYLLTD